MEALGVIPMHPGEGGEFDVVDGSPRSLVGTPDQFGIVEPVDRLGEGIIERITHRSDRRDSTEFGESSPYRTLVNCDPASEWVTSPSRRVPRAQWAISRASSTMLVRMWVATRQPTMCREKASVMKHTYAIPAQVAT